MDKLTGVTLTPAYGRDYKSKKEVIAALNEPQDFVAHHYTGGTGYCSVADLADGTVNVRIKKMTHVVVIKIKGGVAS